MKARSLVSVVTSLAVASTLVLSTPAQAQQRKPQRNPDIVLEVDSDSGTPVCEFAGETDQFKLVLAMPERYWALKKSILESIRSSFPEDAALFDRADEITGTGHAPKEGSLESAELKSIMATVGAHMIAKGFKEDGSETYLAFWHSKQGLEATDGVTYESLQLLPPLTLEAAKGWIAVRAAEDGSLEKHAEQVYTSAGRLRLYIEKLDNASVPVLNRTDTQLAGQAAAAAKETTVLTPSILQRTARFWAKKCITTIRLEGLYNSNASSNLSSDPMSGSSADRDPDKGNLSSGSAQVIRGEGLSSPGEVVDTIRNGSSDDKQNQSSTLLLIVSLVGAVATAAIRFAPLLQNLGTVFQILMNGDPEAKTDQAPGEG